VDLEHFGVVRYAERPDADDALERAARCGEASSTSRIYPAPMSQSGYVSTSTRAENARAALARISRLVKATATPSSIGSRSGRDVRVHRSSHPVHPGWRLGGCVSLF